MKELIYSISEHQKKYFDFLKTGSMFNPKEIDNFDLGLLDYQYGVTNSYFGYNTTSRIRVNAKSRKIISFGHSMFGSSANYNENIPSYETEYFLCPEAWNEILEYKNPSANIIQYRGHYMSLYHYLNPPKMVQNGHVLYLPVSGIKSKEEVLNILKNINCDIYIKPHPTSFLDRPPRNWNEDAIGITIKDYRELEIENSKIHILENIELIDAIDASKYIIGTPPTSCLVETAIRARMHKMDKRIVATSNFEGVPEKYGMSIVESPFLNQFGFVYGEVIESYLIGKKEQEYEIKIGIKECLR